MDLNDVPSCCTATFITDFYNFLHLDEKRQLRYLMNDEDLLTLCEQPDEDGDESDDLGQCLLFTIITDEQEDKIKSLKALGFEEALTAPKDGEYCRHKDSGALHLWWSQPWIVDEKRRALIKKLGGGLKIEAEERARRLTFPELRLVDIQKTEVWKEYLASQRFPIEGLRRANDVPMNMAFRTKIRDQVMEMTGGYDYLADEEFMRGDKTFGSLKDRAIMYREGKIL
jgi:hypothetical protein